MRHLNSEMEEAHLEKQTECQTNLTWLVGNGVLPARTGHSLCVSHNHACRPRAPGEGSRAGEQRMYIPTIFAETDQGKLHDFIEAHAFGLLVSSEGGIPVATHLPFLLERDAAPHGC